jgi:hypothetical protein
MVVQDAAECSASGGCITNARALEIDQLLTSRGRTLTHVSQVLLKLTGALMSVDTMCWKVRKLKKTKTKKTRNKNMSKEWLDTPLVSNTVEGVRVLQNKLDEMKKETEKIKKQERGVQARKGKLEMKEKELLARSTLYKRLAENEKEMKAKSNKLTQTTGALKEVLNREMDLKAQIDALTSAREKDNEKIKELEVISHMYKEKERKEEELKKGLVRTSNNAPIPPTMTTLVTQLTLSNIAPKDVSTSIDRVAKSVAPQMQVKAPSVTYIKNMRKTAGVLADIQGAALLSASTDVTAINDGTTHSQHRFGATVFTNRNKQAFTIGSTRLQANHSAELSNFSSIEAVNHAQDLLDKCRQSLEVKKVKHSLPPPLPLRTLPSHVINLVSDHANVQQKQNDLFAETVKHIQHEVPTSKVDDESDHSDNDTTNNSDSDSDSDEDQDSNDEPTLNRVYCHNHKRSLLENAVIRSEKKWFDSRGISDDKSKNNIVDTTLREASKMFAHSTFHSYVFGAGVVEFKQWMHEQYPNLWEPLSRHLGGRHDAAFENGAKVAYMWTYYLEYLLCLEKKKTLNRLAKHLLSCLSTAEIKAAMVARGRLWFALFQPLRDITNSNTYNTTVSGMTPYLVELDEFLADTSTATKNLCAKGFILFKNTLLQQRCESGIQKKQRLYNTLFVAGRARASSYDVKRKRRERKEFYLFN